MSGFFAMIRNSLGGAAVSKVAARATARDRLSVMLVHQRNSDFVENIDMDALQKEVALVIKKYIKCADKVGSMPMNDAFSMLTLDASIVNYEQAIMFVRFLAYCTTILIISSSSSSSSSSSTTAPRPPRAAHATRAEARGRVRLLRDALPFGAELASITAAGHQDEAKGRAKW